MKHYYLNPDDASGEHYAIDLNCLGDRVLLQIGDRHGQQARLVLTPDQACVIAAKLVATAEEIENLAAPKNITTL